MIIDKLKKEDVIGVIQFMTSREDFYKQSSKIVQEFHYRMTFPKSEDDFNIIKKFGKCKMYIVGTKNNVEYNQLWFVKQDTESDKELDNISSWKGNVIKNLKETSKLLIEN